MVSHPIDPYDRVCTSSIGGKLRDLCLCVKRWIVMYFTVGMDQDTGKKAGTYDVGAVGSVRILPPLSIRAYVGT